MKELKDYLTAIHGNGPEQEKASKRLIESWVRQTKAIPVPLSFVLSTLPLSYLYVTERLIAVADGATFLPNNPGQPKRAFRDHEIHKAVEERREKGSTLDGAVRQTREELQKGLSGLEPEHLSERSVKNIHARSSSKTDEEWVDFVVSRYRELGLTIIDDE